MQRASVFDSKLRFIGAAARLDESAHGLQTALTARAHELWINSAPSRPSAAELFIAQGTYSLGISLDKHLNETALLTVELRYPNGGACPINNRDFNPATCVVASELSGVNVWAITRAIVCPAVPVPHHCNRSVVLPTNH